MFKKFLSVITDLFLFVLGFGADVVTVTAGSAGNAGSTAAELITYMSARLLEVAEFNTILDQFGDKHPLPSNSSKTIRFVREEKLTVAATPTQLTEGIPPDAVGLTLNQIEATIEQYGSVVRLSDLAEITARHSITERTIYILGLKRLKPTTSSSSTSSTLQLTPTTQTTERVIPLCLALTWSASLTWSNWMLPCKIRVRGPLKGANTFSSPRLRSMQAS